MSTLRLVIGLIIGAHWVGVAEACKCVQHLSPARTFERADAVVEGRVEVLEVVESRTHTLKAQVSVERGWKNTPQGPISVLTDGTCAVEFEQGQRYLLYLTQLPEHNFGTDRCSGTAPRAASQRALYWLNRHFLGVRR